VEVWYSVVNVRMVSIAIVSCSVVVSFAHQHDG
jgi:hypothetical protein